MDELPEDLYKTEAATTTATTATSETPATETTTTEVSDVTTSESVSVTESSDTTTTTTTNKPVDKVTYGDVNADGVVDLIDIIVLNKYMVDLMDLTEQQLANANCNTVDGTATPNEDDVTTLMQFVIFMITELPVTE